MSASAVQNVFPQGTAGAVCVSQAALAGFQIFFCVYEEQICTRGGIFHPLIH